MKLFSIHFTKISLFSFKIQTIESAKDDSDIIASVMLLSMGIKSVPEPVLRKTFSDTVQLLLQLLQKFIETDSKNIVRNVIGCLSVLLQAQEYTQWNLSVTFIPLDAILPLCLHSKPKVS